MMGVGYLGHGGSSSSSNLSPLAQPFTVDRSFTKPNPNPWVRFPEEPYAYPFKPSGNWLHFHPPTSMPETFSSPNFDGDSINGSSLSCASRYGYYGSQSFSSPSNHIPSLMPTTTTTTTTTTSTADAFPYGQRSETVKTSLVEAKPYYPQYPFRDNGTSVVHNESRCDMLSSSSFVPLDDSYQTNYAQSLSGLGYNAQWGGFWDGLSDSDEGLGRREDLDGNLFQNENNGTSSSSYTCSLKQGAPAAECLTAKRVDIFASKCPIASKGTGWLDNRCSSVSEETPWVTPFDISRPSVLDSSSILQEVSYPQAPFPVSVMEPWSNPCPSTASYDRCFTKCNSCMTDATVSYPSMTNSLPTLVFGALATGTSSSALKTTPSKEVNYSWQLGDAFDNNGESSGRNTFNTNEPHIQLSAKGKEACSETSVERRGDPIFVDSSPVNIDEPSNQKPEPDDSLDHFLKEKYDLKFNHFKLPDDFTLVTDAAAACDSVDPSDTFDQFNLAVDSPCWKGAPASCRSPFGVTEVVAPHLLVKEFEGCNSLNLEGPQIHSVNADDAVAFSSQEVQGSLVSDKIRCVEDSSLSLSKGSSSIVSFPLTEHGLEVSVKAGSYHSKVNIGHKTQCSEGIEEMTEPRKEYLMANNLKRSSELKSSLIMQLGHADHPTSAKQLASEAAVADSGIDIKNQVQDGSSYVPFHAMECDLSSPSSGFNVPNELVEPSGRASDIKSKYPLSKIDVRLLVNAMHNLSDLLLSSCSNDLEALKEQDHEVLQHVINNLDMCLLKKDGLMRPMPQLQFPRSSTQCLRKLTDLQKGTGTGRPQVNREQAFDVQSQCDYQSAHEEARMHSTVSDNELQDCVSLGGDRDIQINNDVAQAMKKILKEKFDEEETHPQTIVYKNLWLEAEAALCSVKYKARYARIKIEMEKCEPHQTKDVEVKPTNMGKQLSRKVSRELSVGDMLMCKAKGGSVPNIFTKDTTQSGIASQAEDINGSIMTRFRILQSLVNKSSSMNKEGQLPDSIGIGASAGKEEASSSPPLTGVQVLLRRPNQPSLLI